MDLIKGLIKFDSSLMFLVNKSVKVYNSVTGGTKEGLSNLLHSSASIIEVIGFSFHEDTLSKNLASFGGLVGSLALTGAFMYTNREKIKTETELLESGVKPSKNFYAGEGSLGYFLGFFGSALGTEKYLARDSLTKSEGWNALFLSSAQFVRGLALQVMRADYLPPRKSVFERAYDSVKEKISNSASIPATSYASDFSLVRTNTL